MDVLEARQDTHTRHPWETVRFRFFLRWLIDSVGLCPGNRVLDIGAGDGWFSTHLAAVASREIAWVCWDKAYETQRPNIPAVPGVQMVWTAEEPQGLFDVVLLLDVLEHIEDDKNFLRDVVIRHLKPGGTALISVPMWPRLFSAHDRFLHHVRRYTPAEIKSVIDNSGLKVTASGGLFHSLLLLRWGQVMLERLRPAPPKSGSDWSHGRLVTWGVEQALRVDAWIGRSFARGSVQVPGLSWWALCRNAS